MSQKALLAGFDAAAFDAFVAAGMGDAALYLDSPGQPGPGTPCSVLVDRGLQAWGDDAMSLAGDSISVRFQLAEVSPSKGGMLLVDGDRYRLAELLDDDGAMVRWAVSRV